MPAKRTPKSTDADLEALIERHNLRERVAQPEVQKRVREAVARGRSKEWRDRQRAT